MKTIYLIRHGQTDWNAQRRYMGSTDEELNDVGRRQAEDLSGRLAGISFDKIVASDMKRTMSFARLVFVDHPIEPAPDLREMNFGVFEGRKHEELMQEFAGLYPAWLLDPAGSVVPGMEDYLQFRARVMRGFYHVTKGEHGSRTAIVTHGGVIRVIMGVLFKDQKQHAVIPETGQVFCLRRIFGFWFLTQSPSHSGV